MEKRGRRKLVLAALLAAALLVCGFTGCRNAAVEAEPEATATPQPVETYPEGTLMGDVDISGMRLEEAVAACRDALAEKFAGLTVTLTIGDQKL